VVKDNGTAPHGDPTHPMHASFQEAFVAEDAEKLMFYEVLPNQFARNRRQK
jgi:hypothetical protein